jgi:hypothetical protein
MQPVQNEGRHSSAARTSPKVSSPDNKSSGARSAVRATEPRFHTHRLSDQTGPRREVSAFTCALAHLSLDVSMVHSNSGASVACK